MRRGDRNEPKKRPINGGSWVTSLSLELISLQFKAPLPLPSFFPCSCSWYSIWRSWPLISSEFGVALHEVDLYSRLASWSAFRPCVRNRRVSEWVNERAPKMCQSSSCVKWHVSRKGIIWASRRRQRMLRGWWWYYRGGSNTSLRRLKITLKGFLSLPLFNSGASLLRKMKMRTAGWMTKSSPEQVVPHWPMFHVQYYYYYIHCAGWNREREEEKSRPRSVWALHDYSIRWRMDFLSPSSHNMSLVRLLFFPFLFSISLGSLKPWTDRAQVILRLSSGPYLSSKRGLDVMRDNDGRHV